MDGGVHFNVEGQVCKSRRGKSKINIKHQYQKLCLEDNELLLENEAMITKWHFEKSYSINSQFLDFLRPFLLVFLQWRVLNERKVFGYLAKMW